MIVNSVSAYNLSGTEYGLETRLQTTMISNNVSARRENLREDFREFTPFVLPIPRSRPTSRHSDPRRIARQSLIRYSETDWTLKRQLAQPEKVFLRNQDEWIGLKLRRDPSIGAFVVRPEPEKDLPAMEKVVGEVRAFFHGIGITNTAAARHGAIFIMDALFKPHFGHVIANGEIGVSPTHYHIGVNDPRYFSRHVLAKMDREFSSSSLRLASLSTDVVFPANLSRDSSRIMRGSRHETHDEALETQRCLQEDGTEAEEAQASSTPDYETFEGGNLGKARSPSTTRLDFPN